MLNHSSQIHCQQNSEREMVKDNITCQPEVIVSSLERSKEKITSYSQRRTGMATIIVILSLAIFPLGLIVALNYWKNISAQSLTTDVNAFLGQPFYLGFLSQLGIFIWASMATICLLTAIVLKAQPCSQRSCQFFAWSGLMVLYLGLDDAFLLHEEFFPVYLGIPEKVIYAFYAVFLSYYLWRFKGFIRRSDCTFLWIAFVCFALSVSLDVLAPPYINPYFFEDGFKFIGLVAWLTYFGQAAISMLRRYSDLS